MGLFDFFKKKTEILPQPIVVKPVASAVKAGRTRAEKVEMNSADLESLHKTFIAFDVETTGLSSTADRIIEIGAVVFVNGIPTRSFETLVNPQISISASATAVNHITNAMLSTSPGEVKVYAQFVEFLGEALHGGIIICAHNAKFDFDFLCNTLSRLGYDANIHYVDTLNLSRKYIKGLDNYKQGTVASYFGLSNDAEHRAKSDAEICGNILCGILGSVNTALEEKQRQITQAMPSQEELEVCAFIQNLIGKSGGDTCWLRYRKDSSNYIDITCLYTFLKFKFTKKGKYAIIKSCVIDGIDMSTEPCTVSEGGTTYIRVYFNSPFELEPLSNYIFSIFSDCYQSMQRYIGMSNYAKIEAEQCITALKLIENSEMENLLLTAKGRKYEATVTPMQMGPVISREDIVINAVHNHIPLNEIKNLGNWEKGFDAGYPYWEHGETARKDGRIDEAINLFDKSRYNGYDAPVLYDSYAKAYRQIKDYGNEIMILEEGITRGIASDSGVLEARRNKAIKLLFTQQESERKAQEKALAKEQNAVQKVKEATISEPKQPRGRSIIQMNDDGINIKEYNTIAAAVKETGISSKSIRDAANGVQKHAGGYRWQYKNQLENISS